MSRIGEFNQFVREKTSRVDEFSRLLPEYLKSSRYFKDEDPSQIVDRFEAIEQRLSTTTTPGLSTTEQVRLNAILEHLATEQKEVAP